MKYKYIFFFISIVSCQFIFSQTWYRDYDGDGYGASEDLTGFYTGSGYYDGPWMVESTTQPSGYVSNKLDCFDVDPNANIVRNWYRDADGDGAGNPSDVVSNCVPLYGRVSNNRDCNDNDPNDVSSWYIDSDGDGYGKGNPIKSCYQPAGYVNNSTDCDDNDDSLNPSISWYEDVDGDGLGAGPVKSTGCFAINSNDVKNNLDQCPTVIGEGTADGCPYVPTTLANGLSDDNYVYVQRLRKPVTNISQITSDDDVLENITYYDGIGRPRQSIAIRTGGNGQDIITGYYYDNYSRPTKEYLPYANASSQGGKLQVNPLTSTHSFYNTTKYENTLNPYSEKHLEASPLNRVLEQGAPGADWAVDKDSDTDHTIKFGYQTNTDSDYVKRYGVSFVGGNTENPELIDEGVHPSNQLYKTITKDENWKPNQTYPNDHTTEEYKDKEGRVVLKRMFNLGKWHDTYYVYDDYGNLTYVLPPKMHTYKSILQQNWIGQSYSFNNVYGLFNPGTETGDIELYFTSDGKLGFTIYTEGNNLQLKDGLVMNMDFIDPPLPNINLGSIQFSNGNTAGTAYIQSGNLYFGSSGLSSTGGNSYEEFYFPIDLANYQSNFSPSPIDQTQLSDLAYQYRYDDRNRPIEKKIPGKGWESIVYNKLDQPILTQDANLKANGKWLFTKYDAFGRVAYTGIMNSTDIRENLQSDADTSIISQFETKSYPISVGGATIVYANNSYPQTISEVHTINYYDNYSFDGFVNLPSSIDGQPVVNNDNASATQKQTKGLATCSKVRVLNGSSPAQWITTVMGYDIKGRAIYVKSTNDFLGTTDIVENTLDFTGRATKSKTTHIKTGQIDIITIDTFEYDHAGRPKTQKQNINGQGEELIAKNHYDELGQLVKKDVGNSEVTPLQQIDYTYNIRGWLKTINNPNNLSQANDLFSLALSYNKKYNSSTSYFSPLYNGNISQAYWKTNNTSSSLRNYSYNYDALNRLTSAYYAENNIYNNKYNEYIYNYDRNGNIGQLNRNMQNPSNPNSSVSMDYLTYTYDKGNKLLEVKDFYGLTTNGKEGFKDGSLVTMPGPGNDYGYDANGNMRSDANKGITSIAYNHLNLPTSVNINYDSSTVGNVSYVYDATGVKLRKTINDIGILEPHTYYAGNYVYETSTLKFFNHSEGYVEPKVWNDLSQGFVYVYQYKDHLGNVRLSYRDNSGSLEILEENNYYPFGMKHKGYNNMVSYTNIALKKKFAGEEFEDELGKNTVAFQWRDYDPAIGRFNKIDRFAEKYYGLSPYNYTANDPISMIDIAGDSISVRFYNEKGERVNSVPSVVQKMFNSEYGIKVGYNSRTGMLYYNGEIDTDNTVSASAKGTIVGALKETDAKKIKGFGSVTFGYNLDRPAGGIDRGIDNGGTQGFKYAYIDLADYKSDGSSKSWAYNNVPIRAMNMARVFEHEWIGHVLNGAGDVGMFGGRYDFNAGGAANIVNEFRKEMGLPIRLNYGLTGSYGGSILFGNNQLSGRAAKQTAKSYVRRLEKYSLSKQGSISDIPILKSY